MTLNKSIYIVLLFAYFCAGSLKAQQDSLKKFEVPEMKIHQAEKDSNAVYGFNDDKNYVYIMGDTVKVDPLKYKYAVSINDVHSITLNSGNSFWRGALAGGVLGFLLGFSIGTGSVIVNERGDVLSGIAGGLLISLPVAALLGTICLGIPHEIDFDLSGYPVNEKKALLIKILRDNRLSNESKLR